MTQIVTLLILLLYIGAMVGIGLYCRRSAGTLSGFLLGGRSAGPWLTAFSYGTSYFSAVIFIGYAGMHGWNIGIGSLWIGIGNAVLGCLLAWLLLAGPTRRMTQRLDASTMPEFFSKRFQSTGLKVYAAVIIFVFLVPYAASVYKGLGTLFSAVFPGVGEEVIMLIVAFLTAAALFLGGYKATAITDFVQGLIMIVGIIAMVIVVITRPEVGGLTEGLRRLTEIDPQLTDLTGGSNFSALAVNIALTSFGVWGLPQMIHKYYAIRDEKSVKPATIIATGFALIIGVGAYLVGSFGHLFVPAAADGSPALAGGYDAIIPHILISALSSNIFLVILLGIILLLLLSASMSTLSALVLSSSSAIGVDLLKVIRPNIQEKHQVRTVRWLCLVFVVLSYLFATMNISFIVNLMSFSWGIVAGCFIGPFLWGLYVRRTTRAGAWAGALSGIVVVGGLVAIQTALYGFQAAKTLAPHFGIIAMIVSVVIVPVVSLVTRPLPEEHLAHCFGSKKAAMEKSVQPSSVR